MLYSINSKSETQNPKQKNNPGHVDNPAHHNEKSSLKLSMVDFDYYLPKHLIAQRPQDIRDRSRLMILDRKNGQIEERRFKDIIDYLYPGDVLILNTTRVLPARLFGRKESGGKVEVLLLNRVDTENEEWEALCRPGKRLNKKAKIIFNGGNLTAEADGGASDGKYRLKFFCDDNFIDVLESIGEPPLPPYIKERADDDRERYQTVYAKENGSVAAPTAGLHFTDTLLREIRNKGIDIVEIILHLGWASFRPIRNEDLSKFRMQEEFYSVSEKAAVKINLAKSNKGRVIAVGSSVVRVLESLSTPQGKMKAGSGWTDLFIYPPYNFKIVDVMVTNFHIPRSTHLAMVTALAGHHKISKAYNRAMKNNFRFYSYGDSMLII